MENLQFKIYNTLVKKISIPEFEQFLYTNEDIMSNLESNSFFYKIITLNYRLENSLLLLENVACLEYDEDFKKVLTIEQCCIEITQKTNLEEYYNILKKIMINLDYDQDSSVFWDFFEFNERLELIFSGYGYEKEDLYRIKLQSFAEKILSKLRICTSLKEKRAFIYPKPIPVLIEEKIESETTQKIVLPKKTPLRKKIAQFFSSFAKVH